MRNSRAVEETSHRDSTSFQGSFPLYILPDPKEERRMAPDPKPKKTEQVHPTSALQNGIPCSSASGVKKALVGSNPGLERCLSACGNPSFLQAMARFRLRQSDVQIQVPTIRTLDSTKDLHKSSKGDSRALPKTGDVHLRRPRRLAPDRPVVTRDPEVPTIQGPRDRSEPRLHRQLQEVVLGPITKATVSRSNPRLQERHGFPVGRKSVGHSGHSISPSPDRIPTGRPVDEDARTHSQHGVHPSPLSHENESHPATCPRQLQQPELSVSYGLYHL